MIADALIQIAAGAVVPALGFIGLVVNPKLAKKFKGYVPSLNRYQMMAKVMVPMLDPKLAQHMDLVDAVLDTLRGIANGKITIPGLTNWMRKLAMKLIGDNARIKLLLDAIDDEFQVTAFNRVNNQGVPKVSGFIRVDEGEVINENV